MNTRILRDWLYYSAIALGIGGFLIYLLANWCESVGGLGNLLTFWTGILVWYYLVETRRLRVAASLRDQPFLVLTFEPSAVGSPAVFLRNLGNGMAVDVHLRWESLAGIDSHAIKKDIAVVSPHPHGKTIVAALSPGDAVDVIEGARVHVSCRERTGSRDVLAWTWVGDKTYWHEDFGGDGFRIDPRDS